MQAPSLLKFEWKSMFYICDKTQWRAFVSMPVYATEAPKNVCTCVNKMEPRQAGNTFGRHERRLVSKRHMNMSERMARLRNWCISNAIHLSQLLPQPSAVPTAVGGGSSVVPGTSVGRGWWPRAATGRRWPGTRRCGWAASVCGCSAGTAACAGRERDKREDFSIVCVWTCPQWLVQVIFGAGSRKMCLDLKR